MPTNEKTQDEQGIRREYYQERANILVEYRERFLGNHEAETAEYLMKDLLQNVFSLETLT